MSNINDPIKVEKSLNNINTTCNKELQSDPSEIENGTEISQSVIEFSNRIKLLVFTIAVTSQILNQASTDELYPALPIIQKEFNATTTVINITVSIHSLMVGLLSAVWGSYADNYGRRPVAIVANTFSILGNIGSALSGNISLLIFFRLLGAIGAAASNALGTGMINDVFKDNQKGKAISWYSCSNLYCMAFSPFIGGILTQFLGWRSISWSFVITYSLLWLTIVLLLPETNAYIHKKQQCDDNCKIEKRDSSFFNSSNPKITTDKKAKKSFKERINITNPFASLRLLKSPNMLLCSTYVGLISFANNAIPISFTWAYSTQYHFSSTMVGLCYLSGLAGTTTASYLAGFLSDKIYMRRVEKANDSNSEVFPEMRLSQSILLIAASIMAGAFIGYGFSIEKNIHFSAGIIFQTLGQFGYTLAYCFIIVYIVQSFPKHVSSAQACTQTIKSTLMAISRFSTIELQNIIGYGLLYTIIGSIVLLTSPFIIYIQRNCSKWQKKRENL